LLLRALPQNDWPVVALGRSIAELLHLDDQHREYLSWKGGLQHLQQTSRLATHDDGIRQVLHATLEISAGDQGLAQLDFLKEISANIMV